MTGQATIREGHSSSIENNRKHMKKIDYQEFAKAFIARDRFARDMGIELLEVSPGKARARLEVTDAHLNGLGMTQGGAVFTLADLAFAAASNSRGTVAVAINASISFMKGTVAGGVLTAEAEEITGNPKLSTYAIRVTDDAGDVVAIFQGMVYRKKDRLVLD